MLNQSLFDVLQSRGLIKQMTAPENEIKNLLNNEKITFYIGFDPTADSLHIGHFVQAIVIKHMMDYGHTPIILLGGGTAYVGDPSGRTDLRSMMTPKTIKDNVDKFAVLFKRFIEIDEDCLKNNFDIKNKRNNKALILNNADWLLGLNYVDFIRDIGKNFSVNKMLTAECFKSRLEKGLSFLEFNYMLLQSYDFLHLNENFNCSFQLGGDDQWSNILAGIDLIRRVNNKKAYGLTFSLLETKEGIKMGKTSKGALWLDEEKTSCFDFFQYFRNVNDEDVLNCLKLLTFLPIEEIESLVNDDINKAKETLAFNVTKLVHGEEKAKKALDGAKALFSNSSDSLENVPSRDFKEDEFKGEGIGLASILLEVGLTKSNSEGMRAIEQGGIMLNDIKEVDKRKKITVADFKDNKLLIKKGKKSFFLLKLI